jgi:hypothetical protein
MEAAGYGEHGGVFGEWATTMVWIFSVRATSSLPRLGALAAVDD